MNSRRAFTLIELLVVMAIIAILAAILLPVLSSAKARAKSAYCLNSQKQLMLATTLYMDDNKGFILPLWIQQGAPDWPNITYNPTIFSIQNPNALWWPDNLRVGGEGVKAEMVDCPALSQPATLNDGGSVNANHPLGIGMNFPEYGWTEVASGGPYYPTPYPGENNVAHPSQSIVYADAGGISNSNEPDADNWNEIPGSGSVYFRVRTAHIPPATPVPFRAMPDTSTWPFLTGTLQASGTARLVTRMRARMAPRSGQEIISG
jgi:prepilin-type N-terminal cleavage/methylation domain-containing protein